MTTERPSSKERSCRARALLQRPGCWIAYGKSFASKHYSIRTEQAYLQWIRRYIHFHGRWHPCELGSEELRRFLSDLGVRGNVAASTQNQALHTVLFLYRDVLQIDSPWVDAVEGAKKL